MIARRHFLASIGALAALPTVNAPAQAASADDYPALISRALVLSGGGARGAYQAGLICGLASRGNVADGQPLSPYGLVCGTSIGAINAWFVATGQYSQLRRAWQTIASSHIFSLKKKYASVERPHTFILARIVAALRVATGLTTHEKGLADSEPVLDWLRSHIDPQMPLVMPMVWSATNLTTQTAEYFYRVPPETSGNISEPLMQSLRFAVGKDVVIRESSDEHLHRELFASAAIPIVFEPVILETADGGRAAYADGGIASNVNVSIARTIARAIDIVFVDPGSELHSYENAIDITLGAYATMQRTIIESEMRFLYFDSLGKKAAVKSPQTASALLRRIPELKSVADLPATELLYKRPRKVLDAGFTSFDEQAKLDATFATGFTDSNIPFTPYAWETFAL